MKNIFNSRFNCWSDCRPGSEISSGSDPRFVSALDIGLVNGSGFENNSRLMSGLASVSFRHLSPKQIIFAANAAGLKGIEWGGDVHVPPGDVDKASDVALMTMYSGLRVLSYGSYYRVGCYNDPALEFSKVLMCAKAMRAPVIRVWAYNKGSCDISAEEYRRIVCEARLIADMAQKESIIIAFECHSGTLTDDYNFELKLLHDISHPFVKTYWQPNQFKSLDYNFSSARSLAPFTVNIHVFNWSASERFPLSLGENIWIRYIDIFRSTGLSYGFLLEFMPDDRVESLPREAETLLRWL